jgi:hypothetical protein
MWASPFNDKKSFQWESYLATELNENAYTRERDLENLAQEQFNTYLKAHGLTLTQYYNLPWDQFGQINSDYSQVPPAYTKEEMDYAQEMDRQDRLHYIADQRVFSFQFCVDQSRILHVHNVADIAPYAKRNDCDLWLIDFDAIKNDGYDGVELHDATKMRGTVFWTWDVDSIVIWNPDCVQPIQKEIAYIARSIADAKNEFDQYDFLSDDVTLCRWVAENLPVINQAIADGILDKADVVRFIENAIELDNQRRGLNQQIQSFDSQDAIEMEI